MTAYLLELTLFWAASYLLYVALLSRQTFFRLNRIYLLTTFLLGLFLPLVEVPVPAEVPAIGRAWLPGVLVSGGVPVNAAGETAATSDAFSGWAILWVAGGLVAAARLLTGLWQIAGLLRESRKTPKDGYVLVQTDRIHMPFSFWRYLFWSSRFEPEPGEARQILRHEEAHIRQGHSFDVLLLEIAGIALWWHPLVYAFRHSLRQVHEYLADATVLQQVSRRQYGELLLLRLNPGLQPALANHFFRSQLKNRIKMMTRTQSGWKGGLRYLLVLPLLAGLLYACNLDSPEESLSATEDKTTSAGTEAVVAYTQRDTIITLDPETYQESMTVVSMDVFRVVEEMPRFPGCEDTVQDPAEREKCAQAELMNFIGSNIRYPEAAREAGVEGMVVVQFVVAYDGQVLAPKIVKGIGSGCDEEVLRIIGEMPRWIPGRHRGKPVGVQFNLPVKFKLTE